jgi:hypothetical protein
MAAFSLLDVQDALPNRAESLSARSTEIFTRHSSTERHIPFRCSVAGCTRGFPNKGGFLRHLREVHRITEGSKHPAMWYCPVTACSRNKNSFPRQWNCRQHLKRAHHDIADAHFANPASLPLSQAVQSSIEQPQRTPSSPTDSCDSQQSINGYASIQSSLLQLKSKKAEFEHYVRGETIKLDSKIRTLEDALQVIIEGVINIV